MRGEGNSKWYIVKKQIKDIDTNNIIRLDFIFRLEEAKTLGIIKKIENGLRIPPVKNSKLPNWNISINKK